jgi:hypothetical protein
MPLINSKLARYGELVDLICKYSEDQDIVYIANEARKIVQIVREKYPNKEFFDQIEEAKKLYTVSLKKINEIKIII